MQRFKPVHAVLTASLLLGFAAFAAGPARAQDSSPAAAATAVQAPLQVVAFGDSLSAGYGLGPGQSFAERLQAELRKAGREGLVVANAGVSGDTTSGALARLEWSVPESADLVIVELGANDALRGVSPQLAEKNLDAILAKLTARGQRVLLAGMKAPRNLGQEYIDAFDPIYPRLARKYGVALYPFFLDGVVADPALNQADGMHPNEKGVSVILERILPAVEKELSAVSAARGTG
ncbi:arylesterase [Aurantimonas sp. Leaf443]|uniref:arylesterase n=1 Tax=Aurantimonas sp. Leaf443 TaxID=1736378 RepID=UPI000701C583|nr:arylesterase [Aurantimonas sp. Leaf443]KQT82245.1 acyl-CoA thioesterase [Aurantimonas sp. Leaf443]